MQANPDFQEAICGLSSALSAVCDWRGRGGTPGEPHLGEDGTILGSAKKGWINKVIEICDEQLLAGYSYGVGIIQSHGSLNDWLGIMEAAFGRPLRETQRKRWTKIFKGFFTQFDRQAKNVNEGGTLIKLMEFVIQITQRKWYIDAYGPVTHVSRGPPQLVPICERLADYSLQKYQRLRIPAFGVLTAPSVLPFHTVR